MNRGEYKGKSIPYLFEGEVFVVIYDFLYRGEFWVWRWLLIFVLWLEWLSKVLSVFPPLRLRRTALSHPSKAEERVLSRQNF